MNLMCPLVKDFSGRQQQLTASQTANQPGSQGMRYQVLSEATATLVRQSYVPQLNGCQNL